jgi:predicted RNA-binding protein YlxR (DUF448 family)
MLARKTPADLIRIAAAGGGLDFDASNKTPNDLIRIAAAAKSGGGQVIFRGVGRKTTNDLIRISAAGNGHVILAD